MLDHCVGDVGAAEFRSGFDLPDRLGLHLVSMCFEQRPEDVPGHPHANVEEDFVRSAQIRASFLDDAAEILEGLSLCFQRRSAPADQAEGRRGQGTRQPGHL